MDREGSGTDGAVRLTLCKKCMGFWFEVPGLYYSSRYLRKEVTVRERTDTVNSGFTQPTTVNTVYAGYCGSPWNVSPGYPVVYSTNCLAKKTVRLTHDIETPEFYRKSSEGQIINNPYDSTRTITEDWPASLVARYIRERTDCPGGGCRYDGSVQTGIVSSAWFAKDALGAAYWGDQPEIDEQSVIDRAVTKAYANCDVSEASVLVTAAEAYETVVGITSILKRAYKIYKALIKLSNPTKGRKRITRVLLQMDVAGLKKLLAAEIGSTRELTARWMEMRYSLRPLIYDAKQLIAAINGKAKGSERRTFRSRVVEQREEQFSAVQGPSNAQYDIKLEGTVTRSFEARAGILANVSYSTIGLWGLDQPIEAIWEIVPCSFVFDWFWNIGKTIQSWTPNVGINQLASWVVTTDLTTYQTRIGESNWAKSSNNGLYNYWNEFLIGPGASTLKTVLRKERSPNPKRSILPRLDIRLDRAKLLDLSIILDQLRRGLISGR